MRAEKGASEMVGQLDHRAEPRIMDSRQPNFIAECEYEQEQHKLAQKIPDLKFAKEKQGL